MILLTKDTLEINEGGITIAEKYPELVGSPKTIMIQTDDNVYYVNVGYNTSMSTLYIKVVKENDNVVQGITTLSTFPYNLLTAKEFNNYFLYFYLNTFYFGKLEGTDDYNNISEADLQGLINAVL